MTGNRKARHRANKLINKTIDAYDLGGARYHGRRSHRIPKHRTSCRLFGHVAPMAGDWPV